MTLAQGIRPNCSKVSFALCVPSDDWTLLAFAHPNHLLLSVSVLDRKELYIFLCVFGCVFPRLLVTNELHIQNTVHPQCESGCFVSIATRSRFFPF